MNKKFKKNDIVILIVEDYCNCPVGSIAKVVQHFDDRYGEWVKIKWIETFAKNQDDGYYYPEKFRKLTKIETALLLRK